MKNRIRIAVLALVLIPATMAAASPGDSLLDKLMGAFKVDCCVGPICADDACWFHSDCAEHEDCLS